MNVYLQLDQMDVRIGGRYWLRDSIRDGIMSNASAFINWIDCLMLMLLFVISGLLYSCRMTDDMFDCRTYYILIVLSLLAGVLVVKQFCRLDINIDFRANATIVTVTCAFISVCILSLWGFTGNFEFDFIRNNIINPVGLISCICLGLPYIFYFSKGNRSNKVFSAIIIFLCFFALILSQSRTGMITAVIIAVEYLMRLKGVAMKKRLAVFGLLLVALVCISFFVNSDSAIGRLLIWQSSWLMFCDSPLWGHGLFGFEREYMNFQAEFLSAAQSPLYNFLADNVNYPFNEIIRLVLAFGIIGLMTVSVLIYAIVSSYRKNPSEKKYIAILSLLALFMLGLFSYPLSYPFTWLVLGLNLYVILKNYFVIAKIRRIVYVIGPVILIITFMHSIKSIDKTRQWKDAYIATDMEAYRDLQTWFDSDPSFLYNYSYVLYQSDELLKSAEVALKCSNFLASYDLCMLKGEIYFSLADYENAIEAFDRAAKMCPNRFVPLYKIFLCYREMDNQPRADAVARTIYDKPVKVQSPIVRMIKVRIFNYLNSIN